MMLGEALSKGGEHGHGHGDHGHHHALPEAATSVVKKEGKEASVLRLLKQRKTSSKPDEGAKSPLARVEPPPLMAPSPAFAAYK